MPKVSVIIPTYNRAQYLPQALDSVLAQTYQDFEVIIVDDGSTDNTREIIDNYIQRYIYDSSKIRYFHQANKGAASARNAGIQQACGEYIAFLDSDDLWLPQKLVKSLDFICKHGFDWVCVASYRVFDMGCHENKKEVRVPNDFLDQSKTRIDIFKNGIFFFPRLPLYVGAVMVRKYCFEKVGLFDEGYKIGEDFDMWFRFAEAGLGCGYLDEPLFIYRVNASSITQSKCVSGLEENLRLLKKHIKLIKLPKTIFRKSYSDFLWRCSELFFASKKYWNGILCLIKSALLYIDLERLRKMTRFIKRRIYRYENCH